jgi:hypothetical protein
MPRNAVKYLTDRKFRGTRRLDDEVLFAMHYRIGVGQFE